METPVTQEQKEFARKLHFGDYVAGLESLEQIIAARDLAVAEKAKQMQGVWMMENGYTSDRVFLCKEIAEGLKIRGYWHPKDPSSSDLIGAIFRAIEQSAEKATGPWREAVKEAVSMLEGLKESLDGCKFGENYEWEERHDKRLAKIKLPLLSPTAAQPAPEKP